MDDVEYTWDDNLLDDGVRTYEYDNANRLPVLSTLAFVLLLPLGNWVDRHRSLAAT